jgi:hypothetical protein
MTSKTMYPLLFEAGTDVPPRSLDNRATGLIWLNLRLWLIIVRSAMRFDMICSGCSQDPLSFSLTPFFDWEQVCAWLGVQVMEGVPGCCRARSDGT